MSKWSTLGLILLGSTVLLRAQNPPDTNSVQTEIAVPDDAQPLTPYGSALLAYKSGKYDEARTAVDAAEKAKPGDLPTEILKAKILTEQHDFAQGEQLLRRFLTPTGPPEVELALGDLLLRKRSFDRAAKYYSLALQAKPDDPDITLKLVYAKIGVSDLVAAGQYASHLSPLNPKNPYDDHASYYFAKAALAQATGNSQVADDNIQTARTDYGTTVTNRYLKTYLEFFTPADKGPNSDITPPPLVNPAPAGTKP
jgi:tetratricopeptide (TPR) repeat protein